MVISDELYMQWKSLIYKIAKKYVNNPYMLELDDLIQIGSIGFIEGIRSFNDSKGIPLINYLSTCIRNAILKEFKYFNYDKRKANWNTISTSKYIDDDKTTIEEILEDAFINISEEVENKIMTKFFEDMFYKYLDRERAYILASKIIYEKTSKDLAIELNYSKEQIDNKYKSSLESLYNKSSYLKLKYKEYTRIKEFKSTHFDSLVEKSAFKHILWRG